MSGSRPRMNGRGPFLLHTYGAISARGGQAAPAEDGEPEIGQPRFTGSAQSETNSLCLGREAPPVGDIEECPVREV